MNNNPTNPSEALARLQAVAEYAARPPQPLAGARGSGDLLPMSDSYRKAVEEFRLWSENISSREEDFKNGRTPKDWHEPRTACSGEAMISFAVVIT